MAILGSELACLGGGGTARRRAGDPGGGAGDPAQAPAHLPARPAGASTSTGPSSPRSATQECGHGTCAEVNPSGCARTDADRDGARTRLQPRIGADDLGALRRRRRRRRRRRPVTTPPTRSSPPPGSCASVMHAPPAGGSYAAYRQAACNYYGACADGVADYADEVMARAVSYGFRGKGSPPPSSPPRCSRAGDEQGPVCAAQTDRRRSGNEIVRIAREPARPHREPARDRTATPTGPASNGARSSSPGSGSGPGSRWRAAPRPMPTRARSTNGRRPTKATAAGAGSGRSAALHRRANGARVLPPTATPAPGDAVLYGTGPDGQRPHRRSSSASSPAGRSRRSTATSAIGSPASGPFLPSQAVEYGDAGADLRLRPARPGTGSERGRPMVDRLRALLDRPLDPRAGACGGRPRHRDPARLRSLFVLGGERARSCGSLSRATPSRAPPQPHLSLRLRPGRSVPPDRAAARPALADRTPRTRRAAPPRRRAARTLRSHRALQHVPYRRGESDGRAGRGARRAGGASSQRADHSGARSGWQRFLRRYGDTGRAYVPLFTVGGSPESRGGV